MSCLVRVRVRVRIGVRVRFRVRFRVRVRVMGWETHPIDVQAHPSSNCK